MSYSGPRSLTQSPRLRHRLQTLMSCMKQREQTVLPQIPQRWTSTLARPHIVHTQVTLPIFCTNKSFEVLSD